LPTKVRGCAEFAQWPADRTERIIEMALDIEHVDNVP
jgi:hypothetical protein